MFLVMIGFRFPIAYIVNDVFFTVGESVSLFWHLVNIMKTYGFTVSYMCTDGAAVNKTFLNTICEQGR